MLGKLIAAFHGRPGPRRALWRHWYEYMAGQHRDPSWRYMNYGYVSAADAGFALAPADEPDRTWVALYHRVAGAVDLRGRSVLEVGSGRGGGAAFVKRYLQPRSVVGVDVSRRAVALCREMYQEEGLSFEVGDAEALPFPSARFDAVVNVESSHCYGSLPAFFAEVRRVLRPGGTFLYADFRLSADQDRWRGDVAASGMEIVEHEDITANVLRAIEQDTDRRLALIRGRFPRLLMPVFNQFAAAPGSRLHAEFTSGGLRYLRFVMRAGASA